MRRSLVIAIGALLFLGAGPSSGKSPAASRGLYVPPGMTPAVDRSRGNGIHDLEYEVDQAYPASAFIGSIQADLRAQGWSVPAVDPHEARSRDPKHLAHLSTTEAGQRSQPNL